MGLFRAAKKLARWQRWLLVVIVLGGVLWTWDRYRTWQEDSQDARILAAAARYGVDPCLIKAVIWRESRFDPTARGAKGEAGLMQIMKDTAFEWARAERRLLVVHSQMFDPDRNIQCGAWYLRKLLGRYANTDNPAAYALADYNAGRANVLKWLQGAAATNSAVFIEQISFPSTRAYVKAVLKRRDYYRQRGFGQNTPVRSSAVNQQ